MARLSREPLVSETIRVRSVWLWRWLPGGSLESWLGQKAGKGLACCGPHETPRPPSSPGISIRLPHVISDGLYQRLFANPSMERVCLIGVKQARSHISSRYQDEQLLFELLRKSPANLPECSAQATTQDGEGYAVLVERHLLRSHQ